MVTDGGSQEGTQGANAAGLGAPPVPGRAAGVDDRGGVRDQPVAEVALAQVRPDRLDRVQLRRVRRQGHRRQVRRHREVVRGVPTGPIPHDDRVRLRRQGPAELGAQESPGPGRDLGADEGAAGVPRRAHRADQGGRAEALIVPAARPQAPLVPDARDAPLLADAGFSLDPPLDPLRLRVGGRYRGEALGQACLNRACAGGSASGGTGRAFGHDRSRRCTSRSMPVAP